MLNSYSIQKKTASFFFLSFFLSVVENKLFIIIIKNEEKQKVLFFVLLLFHITQSARAYFNILTTFKQRKLKMEAGRKKEKNKIAESLKRLSNYTSTFLRRECLPTRPRTKVYLSLI